MINTNYNAIVRAFSDEDEEEIDNDSRSQDASEVAYHFDGFDVEINVKKALTPINGFTQPPQRRGVTNV